MLYHGIATYLVVVDVFIILFIDARCLLRQRDISWERWGLQTDGPSDDEKVGHMLWTVSL